MYHVHYIVDTIQGGLAGMLPAHTNCCVYVVAARWSAAPLLLNWVSAISKV